MEAVKRVMRFTRLKVDRLALGEVHIFLVAVRVLGKIYPSGGVEYDSYR